MSNIEQAWEHQNPLYICETLPPTKKKDILKQKAGFPGLNKEVTDTNSINQTSKLIWQTGSTLKRKFDNSERGEGEKTERHTNSAHIIGDSLTERLLLLG
jgi:hypothetical protein